MRGNLSNDIVSIKIEEGSKRPIALHEKSLFGKIEADTLNLSLIEACYLHEKGRLDVYEDEIKCSLDYLIDLLKNKEIYGKYIVFRDLKDRGYVIKTGFKYGSDFVCIIVEEVREKDIPTILLKLFMKLMRLMHWISQVMLEFLTVLTRNFFWLL